MNARATRTTSRLHGWLTLSGAAACFVAIAILATSAPALGQRAAGSQRILTTSNVGDATLTDADYEFLSTVYERLSGDSGPIDLRDVIHLLRREPELRRVNAHVRQNDPLAAGQGA